MQTTKKIERSSSNQTTSFVQLSNSDIVRSSASPTSQSYQTSLSTYSQSNQDVDPLIQVIRKEEKEQIKSLNNRFACFIEKVRYLEQQNKVLETKWALLQQQGGYTSNQEDMYKAYINVLSQQLDTFNQDKIRLDGELEQMHRTVTSLKIQYEDEMNNRAGMENDFVTLKKRVDDSYLTKHQLVDSLDGLISELDFLKQVYDEEIQEMHSQVRDVAVTVELDNYRDLNLQELVANMKEQYELLAVKGRDEAQAVYKTKVSQLSDSAEKYNDELRLLKGDLANTNRRITKMNSEIESLKNQRTGLESAITEAEERGELNLKTIRAKIAEKDNEIVKAKQEAAKKMRECQELMNIKLGLDFEISTYKKMLEGEEIRIGQQQKAILHVNPTPIISDYGVSSPTYSRSYSSEQYESSGSGTSLQNFSTSSVGRKAVMVKTVQSVQRTTH
ncbi:keratin, type II cytoskeletal 8-like [Narcine bancroftii]|uniref:keratin, type II cytoskeletal 8-like n=1 Tax=Narcine bancroftii TaxID=1343680 RepID=UPI0038314362